MCVINFNIVTVGSNPIAAEGRYRKATSSAAWDVFSIDLLDKKTPDINVNGDYHLQIRVQYPDLTFSDWTPSSLFKVGNCSTLGQSFAEFADQDDAIGAVSDDFQSVLYSSEEAVGICHTPSVGSKLYKDAEKTIPADAGYYTTYGSFAGCTDKKRVLTVNSSGTVVGITAANLTA